MAEAQDGLPSWYTALLGLAEHFRTLNPPNIRNCLHCLQAIFQFHPSSRIQARTHLQLGALLFKHSSNLELSAKHVYEAWSVSQNITSFDDVKYESTSLLAEVLKAQGKTAEAKNVLRMATEISHGAPYWHCRLLFQLAQMHVDEQEYDSGCAVLGLGEEYTDLRAASYSKILFLLSKAMLQLISKKFVEVDESLKIAEDLITRMTGVTQQTDREALRLYVLVLQVCSSLMQGKVKTVKTHLKDLQHSCQTLSGCVRDYVSTGNPADQFQWMPTEHLCVLAYLVTVMHSMQAGYMDKAQKYTDKAFAQINKLKCTLMDTNPILNAFTLMLWEHIIMCRLIMGNKTRAIQEIWQACSVCQQQPRLFTTHGAQLHALLGLYAMSMNCMDAAEAQFKQALTLSRDSELGVFIKLNMAIVYLRTNRQSDLLVLLNDVDPENINTCSHSLKSSASYVKGLQAFFQAQYNDSKRYLRETLRMANDEDLNRLTSCSLVLLGHIYLNLGNTQEALNMVTPAMQLASKIPDVHVQLWASALLKDLYRLSGNQEAESEGFRLHDSFTQQLLRDHFQSSQLNEHRLIQWTTGQFPGSTPPPFSVDLLS